MNQLFSSTKANAKEIIARLTAHGFEAHYVGGCVRDSLLKINSLDEDIATNATYEEARKILKFIGNIEEVGKNYGVLLVDGIEVAQYRSESYQENGDGKPAISNVATMEEDAMRRDFTINAMYQNLKGKVIDPTGFGLQDIRKKLIRAVGNPEDRFKEDASRILRAAYLAAKLNFSIEPNTFKAMESLGHLLENTPNELKGKIVKKAISSGNLTDFLIILSEARLIRYVFPTLYQMMKDSTRPSYRRHIGIANVIEIVRQAEHVKPKNPAFLLAAMSMGAFETLNPTWLDDTEIDAANGTTDSHVLEREFSVVKEDILRLGFKKQTAELASLLVKYHDERVHLYESDFVEMVRNISTDFKNREELSFFLEYLFDIMELDIQSGFHEEIGASHLQLITHYKQLFNNGILDDYIFYRNELPIDGRFVMEHSSLRGYAIGEFLETLVRENIKDKKGILSVLKDRNLS